MTHTPSNVPMWPTAGERVDSIQMGVWKGGCFERQAFGKRGVRRVIVGDASVETAETHFCLDVGMGTAPRIYFRTNNYL